MLPPDADTLAVDFRFITRFSPQRTTSARFSATRLLLYLRHTTRYCFFRRPPYDRRA